MISRFWGGFVVAKFYGAGFFEAVTLGWANARRKP